MNTAQKFVLVFACVATAFLRLDNPWVPNFATMVALSLLCGATCKSAWALAIPLAVRLLTDVVIEVKAGYGFFPSWPFDYTAYLLIGLLGLKINPRSAMQIGGGTLLSIGIYFFLSNSGVWFVDSGVMYPKTLAGWQSCLGLGVPFIKGTAIGNLLAAPLYFGAWNLAGARSSVPTTENKAALEEGSS